MSRCYPFPPPGYEKKARTDDVDLLKKEKDREKKHKKEKKDREKREGEEKREKDRSDRKHRDKTDKKEKHRNKKKDKDSDRDKSTASEEKRLLGPLDNGNGDKALREKKLTGKSEGNCRQTFTQKKNEMDMERNSISADKKFVGQFSGYNVEKLTQNSHLAEHPKDSKFAEQWGRKVTNEDIGSENQLVKLTGSDAKRDEGMIRLVAKATRTHVGVKDLNRSDGDRQLGVIKDGMRFTGDAMAQNLSGMVQTGIDGNPKPVEKGTANRIEGNEKTKQKKDDKGENKHKEKKEKKGQEKDKHRDKKEDKAKENSENKNIELDKSSANNKDSHTVTHDVRTSHLPKKSIKSAAVEANLRKRKDSDTNGFLHGNGIKPNKFPRPTSSSHPLPENGRILETCHSSDLLISGRQGTVNNLKVDSKEHKINGILSPSTTQPSSISSTKSLVMTTEAVQIAEASRKPHPDSKYLNEILTVPKMKEWSDFDDQEWLFQGSNSQCMKSKEGFSGVNEARKVWSEALQIESADVCALPYVIPY